ncbi:regulator of hemoglobinization and erythroid cell expansion protein [Dromaius novaehollandiae]|uniref:regulator of hemoglobinization and erythroid cell expansion protein n=1 Tax=Dromaius novaehollandiae TaxID=8790 RepID=UPI003120023D
MDCSPWWVLVAISAMTLIFHALFLVILYMILSRKIEHLCGGSKAGDQPAVEPERPPAPAPAPAGNTALQAAYAGSSDTSSETSDDSDSSPSGRQVPRAEESLNYTSLRFTAKGRPPAAADYENMKVGADYINMDPKKRKADFWACSSPVAAKSIEYTEVKL